MTMYAWFPLDLVHEIRADGARHAPIPGAGTACVVFDPRRDRCALAPPAPLSQAPAGGPSPVTH
jgi:hypothetical protein